ncbi:PQQ-dependent sugar dehydrogenase [Lacibacter sp. MH-610]|uniref:PQQ-dependent sugar dehydrogenase n=1 Tax=Lacibacter sp. MH-610 TaxID=3020883 RepID=UPI003892482F
MTTFNICVQSLPDNPLPTRMNEVFKTEVLTISPSNSGVLGGGADNNGAWEITYLPGDDSLWVTENRTYIIRKVHPGNGGSRVVANFASTADGGTITPTGFRRVFNSTQANWPQGGMMGMAIHPEFMTNAAKRFVYVAYVHTYDGDLWTLSGNTQTGYKYTSRIVRLTYNTSNGQLESPVSLCDTLPGSNDHNSGRMIIAPVGGTDYLFYTLGDVGAGQFANVARTIKSQLLNSYEGKVLRFNLESTGSGTGLDPWIPDDNPYNNVAPVTGKSAVWNIGHRNIQGFAFGNNRLYGSSHGQFSDDEVNVLEANRNYGHPRIQGFADGNYNNCHASLPTTDPDGGAGPIPTQNTSLPFITNEVTDAATIPNYQDPIFSFFAAPNGPDGTAGTVRNIYTTSPPNSGWPSIAPSGMDLYSGTKIPGWKNSLLLASLKRGYMMRLKLNAAGSAVIPTAGFDTVSVFNTQNRFRDLAISPDGGTIFATIDKKGSTSGPTATNSVSSNCSGCILKYTFLGYAPSGTSPFPSTIPTSIPIDSSTSAGCVTATAVTINNANNNTNLWVPITGPNGNIIAEINANGNELGAVSTSFFTRTGVPVRSWGSNHYLNRNVTINVATQPQPQPIPTNPVSVRLYITAKELADLVTSSGGTISTVNDIGVFKNNDACGTVFGNGEETGQTVTGRYTQSTFGHAIQFNVTSFSSFYFFRNGITLPFELITLNGKAVNDAARLEWIVKNEKDINNYTIERSADGVQFTQIGTVTAKNGSGELKYQFTDFNAAKTGTLVYYRIRSNEASGVGKYTNTISVSFAIVLKTSLAVAPNPAKDKTTVTIQSTADETVQLKVIDNTGRLIKVLTVNLVKGKNNLILEMSDLKAGLYYIDVTGKSINEKTKLIKQ